MVDIQSFALTPFYTNCYVLKDGGESIVIDPGEASPQVLAAVKGTRVKMIFNTHCHCDHCGGNVEMVRQTGAPLAIHEDEIPLLQMLEQQGSLFGVDFPPSPDPDILVKEGDEVTVGAVTMTVRLAPGHSPGHVVLVGDGFVFDGDVLFAGSIGRTDLWGGDFGRLMHSIKNKLMTLPDETVVYSGHGPATTIGRERVSNPFLTGA